MEKEMKPQARIKDHGFFTAAFCALLLSISMAAPALAVDAVWRPDAGINGDWNNNTNWVGGLAPVTAGDTATFNLASVTSLFLSSGVAIDSVTFNPGASAFSIDTSGSLFSFVGAGIVNDSGGTETIVSNAGGTTSFLNSSTAGNAALIAVNGGSILFHGTSTAGNAGLRAAGFTTMPAPSGTISFFDNSTAGNASLTAETGFGSTISFFGNSSAGNARLGANGGVDFFGTSGGSISFFENSSAANSTLTSQGGAGAGGASISFHGTSTADNATMIAEGGSRRVPWWRRRYHLVLRQFERRKREIDCR